MLKIKDLNFSYRKKYPLFKKLNLEIEQPGIIGLLGKNGAGKTTFLKLICGLRYLDAGKIECLGYNPQKRQPEFLQDMFFVPEQFNLPKLKPKRFYKIYASSYSKFDKDLFYEILSDFDVNENQNLSEVSLGQRKKFLIAFALATKSKLLLFDEPTNGLDLPSKRTFRKVISRIITEDQTFIISTHYINEIEKIIDQLVILNQGEISFCGNTELISDRFAIIKETDMNGFKPLYFEKELDGYKMLIENHTDISSQIDYEFFFNAMVDKKLKIN